MKLLLVVTIYIHLIPDWNGGIFGEAATAPWSLKNQMKIEERPYTHPSIARSDKWQGTLERGKFNKILYPKLREMHRNCDGQCFYAPIDCINAPGLREEENDPKHRYHCRLVASIASHNVDKEGKLYCSFFGETNGLRESFCYTSEAQQKYRKETGRDDKFYTVTLHRTLVVPNGTNNEINFYEDSNGKKTDRLQAEMSSCVEQWNEKTGTRCRRTEFVAISFLKQGSERPENRFLHKEDLWYVCTADESTKHRITMWSHISDDIKEIANVATDDTEIEQGKFHPQQILGTSPHVESGMGVIFSKAFYDEDALSMGCQFVLQESNMTLLKPPNHAAFFWDDAHKPITIKLAMGWVNRDVKDKAHTQPFSTIGSRFNYYHVFQGKTGPNGIAPTDEILFDQLEVKLADKSPDIPGDLKLEQENIKTIEGILRLCDNPKKYPHLWIGCYPPNAQPNCIHTGKCAAMFIVEMPRSSKSFKRIKAHVYSNLPDHQTLRKVVRPKGYVSVAFSSDRMMGRDVVVTCHANGLRNIKVFVSLNYARTNIYPGNVSLNHLIENSKTYGSAEQNRILCSWEMNTTFEVNTFSYLPVYRDVIPAGESEKLYYNMEENNYTLLLAAGNRNYPDGTIVYHDFRQALHQKFSKKLFYGTANKVKKLKADPIVIFMFIAFSLCINWWSLIVH